MAAGHRRLLFAAGTLLFAGFAFAEKAVPFLSGRVVDEASMIPQDVRDRLELRLRDLEQATGSQVAVLTVESLEGEVLEQYSIRVAQTWKLGSREKDDGVLLLIAKQDRKMRLEVGYGLEDRLTDLLSRRILDDVIAPHFKAGQFGTGVEDGVKAIAATVQGQQVAWPAPPVRAGGSSGIPIVARLFFGGMFVLVVGVFSVVAVLSSGCQSWFLYVFLMPFHLLFPMVFLTPFGGVAWFLGWVFAFPVVKLWLHKTVAGKAFLKRHSGLPTFASSSGGSSWSSGSSGSSWSSGSSGDSFSGGGGSFGGGGASSSW